MNALREQPDIETRMFAAEAVRDALAETTDLPPGDRNRVAWQITDALAPVLAAAVREGRAEALREHRCKPCGCGWCCASTPTDMRGETHKRTCRPYRADRIAGDAPESGAL